MSSMSVEVRADLEASNVYKTSLILSQILANRNAEERLHDRPVFTELNKLPEKHTGELAWYG